MTVEERARRTVDELFWGTGVNPSKETVQTYMIEALRDQIEECAKKADEHEAKETERAKESRSNGKGLSELGHVFEATAAGTIADNIRALAAPKEEIPDGPDDRFDLGGFECNERQED